MTMRVQSTVTEFQPVNSQPQRLNSTAGTRTNSRQRPGRRGRSGIQISRRRWLGLALALGVIAGLPPARAATRTWTGNASGNWSNASNWSSGAPGTGDDLVFPVLSTASRRITTNNFPAGQLTVRSITFEQGGYFTYGNSLIVTQAITSTSTQGLSEFRPDIVLSEQVAVTINSGAFYLSGVLSGSGGLTKEGRSWLVLQGSAANTFAGPTIVHNGTLGLDKTSGSALSSPTLTIGGLGSNAVVRFDGDFQLPTSVAITVNRDGLLDLNDHTDDLGNLTINAGTVETGLGQLRLRGNVVATGERLVVSFVPPLFENVAARINGNLDLGTLERQFTVNPSTSGSANPDLELAALVSGTGGIRKLGTGQLRVSGANTFSGAVRIQAGNLVAAHNTAFGTTSGGVTVENTGTLTLEGSIAIGTEPLSLNNPDDFPAVLSSRAGTNAWGGSISLLSDAYFDVADASRLNLASIISGSGGLAKVGNGALSFDGFGDNSYQGMTFAKDGFMLLNREHGDNPKNFTVIPHALVAENGATVRLTGCCAIASDSAVTVNAGGVLDINGKGQSIGSLEGAGEVRLGNGASESEFWIGGNGRSTTFSGLISGSADTLIKQGNETLTLTGNNTYTSATKVLGGVLTVHGQQAGSDITVLSGGTLRGTGAVGQLSVGPGGQVFPGGATPGVLSAGSTTFSNNSVFNVRIGGNPPYDQLKVNGTLQLEIHSKLAVSLINDYLPQEGTGFQIINGINTITGQFDDLPNEGLLNVMNVPFRARYTGTPGFDLLLWTEQPHLEAMTTAISGGNDNGVLDPDECNELKVTIANPFGVSLTGLSASLESHTFGVLVTQPDSDYPDLAPSASAVNTTPFQLFVSRDAVCGSRVDLVLNVTGENHRTFAMPITLTIGTVGGSSSFLGSVATPFADQIASLTVPASADLVGKVTVGVFFDPAVIGDLTLSLQSPDGTTVPLYHRTSDMHIMGASCVNEGFVWFEDAASAVYRPTATPTPGTYLPEGSLADFGGHQQGGTWRLVMEGNQTSGAPAQLQCWKLRLSPATCTEASGPCVNCPELPDHTPPLIVCPPAQTIIADASSLAIVPDYTAMHSAVDGCGAVTLSQSPAPGTQVGLGEHWITLTAHDAAGNAAYCGFNLQVVAGGPFGTDDVPYGPGDRVLNTRMQVFSGEPANQATCLVIYGTERLTVANALVTDPVPRGQAAFSGGFDANGVVSCAFIFPHNYHKAPNPRDIDPEIISDGVTVFYKLVKRLGGSDTYSEVRQFVMPPHLTIGLFGDSYASGEGAPDYYYRLAGHGYGPAKWLDAACHRSRFSGFAMAAEELQRTTPTTAFLVMNVTCKGATVKAGLTGGMTADDFNGHRAEEPCQISQVHDILKADTNYVVDVKRTRLNIAVVSIGGNDIGFATAVIKYFVGPLDLKATDAADDRAAFIRKIHEVLPDRLGDLKHAFDMNFEYNCILLTEYPNMLRRFMDGQFVICGGFNPLFGPCWTILEELNSVEEVSWMEGNLLFPLNSVRREVVNGFERWRFVDGIADLSKAHGLCNCDSAFFNTLAYSFLVQQDYWGTLHPNQKGYDQAYRPPVLAALRDAVVKVRKDYARDQLKELVKERIRQAVAADVAALAPISTNEVQTIVAPSWGEAIQQEPARTVVESALNLPQIPVELPPLSPPYGTDYADLDHALSLGVTPRLEIVPSTNEVLVISWPEWAGTMQLESSASLSSSATWQPVNLPSESFYGVHSVRVTRDADTRFYRLSKP